MNRMRPRDRATDAGLSLVEMIVYSMLLVFVVAITGTILIRTLQTQGDVRAIASASNNAQLSFERLERDVRNASKASVAQGGTLLLLVTRQASDTDANKWVCVGYYIDSSGVLRRTSSATGALTQAASVATTPAALASSAGTWPTLATAISVSPSATRLFGPADGAVADGANVTVNLRAATVAGHKPIDLRTSATLRTSDGTALACF